MFTLFIKRFALQELREECLNTIGCKTKQDYIYRIIEEEAAACCDGGDDDDDGAGDDEWKALYAGTEQHDNQAGIHTNAEKEAGVKGGYAAGNGDPAAAAAAAAAAGVVCSSSCNCVWVDRYKCEGCM
jgi:hypothetical protein